jgi:pseudaminic acid cytidylyltransferase
MSKIAIITARGGSKRILRKNIKNFLGKPIIAYSIETAFNSHLFDEVMVSTDDVEIAEIAKSYGAKVPFMRSRDNSDDFSTTADVISEVLDNYRKNSSENFDYACCIYPTAPFITVESLRQGFNLLKSTNAVTAFPVQKFSYPIQRSLKINNNGFAEMNSPENLTKRSQDLEEAYHDAGQFYWLKVKEFGLDKKLLTTQTAVFELPSLEVQDIDTQQDWDIAEFKYQYLKSLQK